MIYKYISQTIIYLGSNFQEQDIYCLHNDLNHLQYYSNIVNNHLLRKRSLELMDKINVHDSSSL